MPKRWILTEMSGVLYLQHKRRLTSRPHSGWSRFAPKHLAAQFTDVGRRLGTPVPGTYGHATVLPDAVGEALARVISTAQQSSVIESQHVGPFSDGTQHRAALAAAEDRIRRALRELGARSRQNES